MAESREPPPLFDEDDVSKKDDESDIFASAVQSPMNDDSTVSTTIPHPLADPLNIHGIQENNALQPDKSDDLTKNVVQVSSQEGKTSDVDNGGASHSSNGDECSTNALNLHGVYPVYNFLTDNETSEILLRDSGRQEISLQDDEDDNTISASLPYTPEAEESPSISPATIPVVQPALVPQVSPNVSFHNTIPRSETPPDYGLQEVSTAPPGDDTFIEITVSDPQKIGDGMGAYMAYKVTTKTNIKYFRKGHWSVTRRFSDFLGLHSKLVDKHLHAGIIIPPAPEKAAIATTKMKLGTDKNTDASQAEFLERRRAALERYINRTAAHPVLCSDPDFREFLELDAELPKATQTSAISSAGVMRLFNKVGETVNKMTFRMEENDEWFEEKTNQIENLDAQLRKLHFSMEGLVGHRRDLAHSTMVFSKSASFLSSVEEHSALSRAMHQLGEATDRVHTIHYAQADADFFLLTETTKDYINIVGAVKEVFHERVKTFQTWQHAQSQLSKKRENKTKAELSGRHDKVDQAIEEVKEWEAKVERSEEEFQKISKAIKKEMAQFDIVRILDYKEMLIKYIEALITSQQQILKVWETFLPEANSIA